MRFRPAAAAMMLALTGCSEVALPAALTILGERYKTVYSAPTCRPADMMPASLEIEGLDLAPADFTASAVFDEGSYQPSLLIKLKYPASDDFAKLTEAKVGETLKLSIDGELVMEPRIMEPIYGGQVTFTSWGKSIEELSALTVRLAPPCN